HEVRAHLGTSQAGRAAGPQLREAVAPLIDSIPRHRQHTGTAGGDAQVAALAGLDVNLDRSPGENPAHGAPASLSSPIPNLEIMASSRYCGPSGVGTNQPVGHMVSTSTKVNPAPRTCSSSARRTMRLVRATMPAVLTAPRAT